MVAEITAAFWDYPGQVLRSFALGEAPTQLYRDLHAAADAAFDAITEVLKAGATPAQVIEASGVIEDAGFTIIDDLLHGYGGGYLPPILGCTSRPVRPGAAGAVPRRADRRRAAQCRDARSQGRRADRRDDADHRDRRRAAAHASRAASHDLSELLRHPVGALRAPAVGAVVGDVVAVLDHHQFDRAFDLARQPLGVGWPARCGRGGRSR